MLYDEILSAIETAPTVMIASARAGLCVEESVAALPADAVMCTPELIACVGLVSRARQARRGSQSQGQDDVRW